MSDVGSDQIPVGIDFEFTHCKDLPEGVLSDVLVAGYMHHGGPSPCMSCGQPLSGDRPPHVFVNGSLDSELGREGMIGIVCQECADKGRDYCVDQLIDGLKADGFGIDALRVTHPPVAAD